MRASTQGLACLLHHATWTPRAFAHHLLCFSPAADIFLRPKTPMEFISLLPPQPRCSLPLLRSILEHRLSQLTLSSLVGLGHEPVSRHRAPPWPPWEPAHVARRPQTFSGQAADTSASARASGCSPTLSLAANKRPPAGNQVFSDILCSGIATRDFARQFEVLQRSNCTDCDSGE